MRILRCAAEGASVPLLAPEETETRTVAEAAEVAAAVGAGVAGSGEGSGSRSGYEGRFFFVGEVGVTESDAGFEARVFGGWGGCVVCFCFCVCFVSGDGEREAASDAIVGESGSGVICGGGRD